MLLARVLSNGSRRLEYRTAASGFGSIALIRNPEVFIQNNQPETLKQGLTAVFLPFRNRGLGRWLKAAAVEKILDELQEARVVVTDNADVNDAMLSINAEMGFRPGSANALWQVSVDAVEAYFADRPEASLN